jgi:hypothetical protein
MYSDLETIYESMLTPKVSDKRPEYNDMYAIKPVDAFEKPTEEPTPNSSINKNILKPIVVDRNILKPIVDDLLELVEDFRKIARENGYNSKIYYRAGKVVEAASQLKQLLGIPSSDDKTNE